MTDHMPVVHIVGRWQAALAHLSRLAPRRLSLFAPRSLCGVVLWGDPDQPDPAASPDTPLCPVCVAVDGRDPDTITARTNYTPGYWL